MGGKYGCQGRLEAATASSILICDYFISRGKVREFFKLIGGVHGKRPLVTSDQWQNSCSKLLSTSLYRGGEFNRRSRVI